MGIIVLYRSPSCVTFWRGAQSEIIGYRTRYQENVRREGVWRLDSKWNKIKLLLSKRSNWMSQKSRSLKYTCTCICYQCSALIIRMHTDYIFLVLNHVFNVKFLMIEMWYMDFSPITIYIRYKRSHSRVLIYISCINWTNTFYFKFVYILYSVP